jgi:hypothetical protein
MPTIYVAALATKGGLLQCLDLPWNNAAMSPAEPYSFVGLTWSP